MAVVLSAAPARASAADPYVVYTANNFANGAVILRTDPATGSLVEISRNGPQGNNFVRPYDLAVAADGSLLVVDMGLPDHKDGAVIRVDPFTGAQSVVSSGQVFYDPAGIAVARDGSIYVVDNLSPDDNGGVIRVDPSTGAQKLISSNFNRLGLFDLPFGIAVDSDGSLVVVNRRTAGFLPTDCLLPSGSVIRVDPASGTQARITQVGSLSLPLGLALDPNRWPVVANECAGPSGAGLVRVNPLNGAQTPAASNNDQDYLRTPERAAINPAGDILVSDYQLGGDFDGGIVKIDRATGAQNVVQTGNLFNHPMGIAAVANRPPAAALSVAPAAIAAGGRVRLDATGSRDPEGLRLVYEWDLDGDGSFESGSGSSGVANPAFAVDGRKVVRVRVNDPHGGRAVAEGVVDVDGSMPRISELRVAARTLALPARRKPGKRRAQNARRPPPRSTSLRFRLSESATVTLAIERARAGRRSAGRPCRVRAKRGRRCTLWTRARTITRSERAGGNAVRLRARGLRPGRYEVVVTAVDRVGNRSGRRTVPLRVVRLRR